MDLLPTSEQEQIIAAASDFLHAELPVERLRNVQLPDAAALWPRMAELGWFAIALPESDAGSNVTLVEEALLHREFGRHLLPPATLGAALGARIAVGAGQGELAQRITSGTLRVGLVVPAASGRYRVIDAKGASLFVRLNRDTAQLLGVGDTAELSLQPCIDPGSSLAESDVQRLPVLADLGRPPHREASVLIAAQLCGIGEALRDLSVAYAGERKQFGQAIGTFQAIKHPCADMAVACEASLSLLKLAALAVVDDLPDADFLAASAKLIATQTAFSNSRASIQIHGGMGISADCPVHFYLKRTHVLNALGGDLREQQRRILEAGIE